MYKLPANGSVRAVYFSLGNTPSKSKDLNCVHAICDLFAEAKESAYVAIYSLTEPNIISSIISAHNDGLEIGIVADSSQSKGKTMASAIKRLESARVPVHITEKQKSLMHNKVGIFDMKTVATGSFNWSKNASERNDENLIVIDGADVAEKYYKYVYKRALDNETVKLL
jgi:phosphatidylserine/phosphatidylglycerophosphate/cardiolipin synthase-like enzyme